MSNNFAYDDIALLQKHTTIPEIPDYLINNLSPKMKMRDYQEKAFQNFITYYDVLKEEKQTWALFHSATGTGKTYLMAGLILFLYNKGYRNFLFFVNQSNIVNKTKKNFLDKSYRKYLFSERIFINGKNVEIKEVDNFKDFDPNAINILFTTVQMLHNQIINIKEGACSLSDFKNKTVLIADEAHHINAVTKIKNKEKEKEEKDIKKSWETTVMDIYKQNSENVMLEFTATCDLNNKNILEKYKGNPADIVYNFPLLDFRNSGYTKDLYNLRTSLNKIDRIIQAMLLSQYRLKLFEKYKIANSKPVILCKESESISICDKFVEEFIDFLENKFNETTIDKIRNQKTGIIKQMFTYYDDNNITSSNLVLELKQAFSREHIIKIHSNVNNVSELQEYLNDLENPANPYRLIFTVDMLSEGWDVLNLFDIVRLYDEHKNSDNTTIQEAQLIGRGARYFPFELSKPILLAKNIKDQRKFDNIPEHELRVCETLYYHCIDDSNYILSLKKALIETGFSSEEEDYEFEYKLKKEFKGSSFYKEAKIFLNKQEEIKTPSEIPKDIIVSNTKDFTINSLASSLYDNKEEKISLKKETYNYEIVDIDKRIILKALRQFDFYNFANLKKHFSDLKSMNEFIENKKYLGKYNIVIYSNKEPSNEEIYITLLGFFEQLSRKILNIKKTI